LQFACQWCGSVDIRGRQRVAAGIRCFRDFFVAGVRMTTPLLECTLVSTYFGLESCTIGAAIARVAAVLGGLLADAITDVAQFVVMCVSVVAVWVVMVERDR
jgi:Na+/pantothenate symporter